MTSYNTQESKPSSSGERGRPEGSYPIDGATSLREAADRLRRLANELVLLEQQGYSLDEIKDGLLYVAPPT